MSASRQQGTPSPLDDASESTMKICHVMRTYGRNGGEKQLAQMFGQPSERCDERFVFVYRDSACEELFRQSSAVLKFSRLWPFAVAPRYSPWKELLLLLPLLPWLQLRLVGILLWRRPDACVVHGFQAALIAWPAAVLMRWIGFAYVHRITKSEVGSHAAFKVIYAPFRKLAGVSVAVTESLQGLAPSSKLLPMQNGIDLSRFQISRKSDEAPAPLILITVGRLLAHKGQDLAIAAFAECALPDAKLWIVGEGEYRRHLEELVERTNVADRVKFLGRREDIPSLLSQADIFIHASAWEGMSNSVLEGMAAELASVVVTAPGVDECHVPGETGLVVARDVHCIAEAIRTLAADPALRRTLGRRARHHVERHYSIEANRARYRQLYESLRRG